MVRFDASSCQQFLNRDSPAVVILLKHTQKATIWGLFLSQRRIFHIAV